MAERNTISALIIDRSPDIRGTLRGMLGQSGIEDVQPAAGAAAAIRKLLERRFDLILCEYHLGDGQDGVGARERRDGPGDSGGECAGRTGVANRVAEPVTGREARRECTTECVAGTGGVDGRHRDGRFAPGLDDIIDSKRAANRPKDQMALPYLESLRDELRGR